MYSVAWCGFGFDAVALCDVGAPKSDERSNLPKNQLSSLPNEKHISEPFGRHAPGGCSFHRARTGTTVTCFQQVHAFRGSETFVYVLQTSHMNVRRKRARSTDIMKRLLVTQQHQFLLVLVLVVLLPIAAWAEATQTGDQRHSQP